mmetsp:Transcript_162030/g.519518  ORF Transcript_162030/g.519518 Transcript_162030/m.519518 type:complete len:390 (+) Transcript_162030:882-2051(+)
MVDKVDVWHQGDDLRQVILSLFPLLPIVQAHCPAEHDRVRPEPILQSVDLQRELIGVLLEQVLLELLPLGNDLELELLGLVHHGAALHHCVQLLVAPEGGRANFLVGLGQHRDVRPPEGILLVLEALVDQLQGDRSVLAAIVRNELRSELCPGRLFAHDEFIRNSHDFLVQLDLSGGDHASSRVLVLGDLARLDRDGDCRRRQAPIRLVRDPDVILFQPIDEILVLLEFPALRVAFAREPPLLPPWLFSGSRLLPQTERELFLLVRRVRQHAQAGQQICVDAHAGPLGLCHGWRLSLSLAYFCHALDILHRVEAVAERILLARLLLVEGNEDDVLEVDVDLDLAIHHAPRDASPTRPQRRPLRWPPLQGAGPREERRRRPPQHRQSSTS